MAEPCPIYEAKTVKARKRHVCEECGGAIMPGEEHEYATGLCDGSWFHIRTDKECVRLREAINKTIRDFEDRFGHGELSIAFDEGYAPDEMTRAFNENRDRRLALRKEAA